MIFAESHKFDCRSSQVMTALTSFRPSDTLHGALLVSSDSVGGPAESRARPRHRSFRAALDAMGAHPVRGYEAAACRAIRSASPRFVPPPVPPLATSTIATDGSGQTISQPYIVAYMTRHPTYLRTRRSLDRTVGYRLPSSAGRPEVTRSRSSRTGRGRARSSGSRYANGTLRPWTVIWLAEHAPFERFCDAAPERSQSSRRSARVGGDGYSVVRLSNMITSEDSQRCGELGHPCPLVPMTEAATVKSTCSFVAAVSLLCLPKAQRHCATHL